MMGVGLKMRHCPKQSPYCSENHEDQMWLHKKGKMHKQENLMVLSFQEGTKQKQ